MEYAHTHKWTDQMFELFALNFKPITSIVLMVGSFIFAQANILQEGFDQLFSLGLLLIAVIVIWKAFNKKDESQTELLKAKTETLQTIIDGLQEDKKQLKKRVDDLYVEIERLNSVINNLRGED